MMLNIQTCSLHIHIAHADMDPSDLPTENLQSSSHAKKKCEGN